MTNLRSSKSSGAEYNKIGSLPFGSELITYSHDSDWSDVKDATGKRGFIASNYIVDKSDFNRLNSILVMHHREKSSRRSNAVELY